MKPNRKMRLMCPQSPGVVWKLLLIAPLLFLSACGGNARLKHSDYSALRSVSVLKKSDIPDADHTVLLTFGQIMAGSLGGIVGATISVEASKNPRLALHDVMVREKIDPGLLVANEFEHQLHDTGLFPVIREPADAQFRFSITTAGLMVPGSFATRLNPEIRVEAQLVRTDGKVIWYDSATVRGDDPDSKYAGHALDEYFNQPNLLRDGFAGAAHSAASMLIEDLQDDLKP